MTRLSVIIPGYNNPDAYWKRCLDSVIAACGPDDEIICVDDGSKKKPSALGLGLSTSTQIKWIYLEKNSGLPTARNAALKVATGEYVTFVDSDDEVVPGAYDRSVTCLSVNGSDIAVFGVKVIWVDNGLYKEDVVDERNVGLVDAQSLSWIYRACLFDYACNKVYRRSFLDKHGLRFELDVRTGEDTVFNCSCIVAGAKWCTIGRIGYVYYRYDGSMLSRYVPNMRATHQRKLEARAAARAKCPGIDDVLGNHVAVTTAELDAVEWRNMWMRASPITLRERWKYLRDHPALARCPAAFFFVRTSIYWYLRMRFYVRPIRRWHVKRLFPNVRETKTWVTPRAFLY